MRTKCGDTPNCFGILENVFPLGEGGLRQSPESCFPCIYKTACLRAAMAGSEGAKVRQESVDRAYDAGVIGFWERWSRRKILARKMSTRVPSVSPGRSGSEQKG